jgi:hypothetical protein
MLETLLTTCASSAQFFLKMPAYRKTIVFKRLKFMVIVVLSMICSIWFT